MKIKLLLCIAALTFGCKKPSETTGKDPRSANHEGITADNGYQVNKTAFAKALKVSETQCKLSDGTTTTCVEIKTPAMPSKLRPFCKDGYAYGQAVAFTEGEIGSCKSRTEAPPGTEIRCVECEPHASSQTWLIPKTPVAQKTPVEGDKGWQLAGGYGLALDGVPISHEPPPKRSPVPAVDACGGHSGPDSDYHYHYIPTSADKKNAECLVQDRSGGGHSSLFGYAMDGYPMHGRYEDGARPRDLDECGGHIGKTPNESKPVYHYHARGAVDADHGNDRIYKPFIQCFRGAIASSDNPQRRGEGSPPPGGRRGGGPPPGSSNATR